MSIHPIAYNDVTKVYRMRHDEGNHEFDALLADLDYSTSPVTGITHYFLTVNCLVCDSSSVHPVSGGAAPVDIQTLFVNKATLSGCACGNIEAGNETLADAHAHLNCARMDGEERWQV
jgi:hypothetical protein